MDTQNNSTNNKQVDTTKSKTKKRKIGCLGCFGYVLLTIVIIAVAFFAVKTIQKKIEEKEEQKLKARFAYEEKTSAEDKITQAFEKGEISADTYILQMAYSVFEEAKLNPLYKSDNEFDFTPGILELYMKYIDELSDETVEYVAKKILMTDIRIHPDASQNQVAYERRWLPFSEYVFANGYDVTVLDKAALSPSGKFLIWYTDKGESAVTDEIIKELAETVDETADNIKNFLDIDWDYDYSKINSGSYEDMKSVLDKCDLDEKALEKALPIFVYEAPNKDDAMAWYCRNVDSAEKILVKLAKFIASEDDIKETSSVYSLPYIVIKTSSISNMESLNVIFAHELTHHFQRIYYNDLSYNASDFTSETTANFVAASIIKNEKTETLLNDHANQYISVADSFLAYLETNKTHGYAEFVWAKSYADIVENGAQYLKESLLQENPYKYLCEKAGASYHLVLEDLAVRNITKEYQQKAFVSTKLPKGKDEINSYMDTKNSSISANCFDYYYIDRKSFHKALSIIYMRNTGDKRIFVKIIGRKKEEYSLIDTLYCEKGKELKVADFSGDDYKEYNEVILALGHCETSKVANYKLASISDAAIDFYETVTGLKELNPWEMNGDCITINVEDFVEGTTTLADYFNRAIEFVDNHIESEDQQITSEYLNSFKDEINTIGEAAKKFGNTFDYKTMRLYIIPIEKQALSDDELHEMALNMMPKPKFKIVDKVEDGMHITSGGSVQPFSKTQIVAYVMYTTKEGEKGMYKIELEK